MRQRTAEAASELKPCLPRSATHIGLLACYYNMCKAAVMWPMHCMGAGLILTSCVQKLSGAAQKPVGTAKLRHFRHRCAVYVNEASELRLQVHKDMFRKSCTHM